MGSCNVPILKREAEKVKKYIGGKNYNLIFTVVKIITFVRMMHTYSPQ